MREQIRFNRCTSKWFSLVIPSDIDLLLDIDFATDIVLLLISHINPN